MSGKRNSFLMAVAIGVSVMLPGCDNGPARPLEANASQPEKPQEKQNPDASKTRPKSNSAAKISALEGRIFELEMRVSDLESGLAEVPTDDKIFGLARTPFAVFPIWSEGVTPYLDGFKIKLAIANPTSVHFNGAKIVLRWGVRTADPGSDEDVARRNKVKEMSVPQSFPPGETTVVDVTITPASAEDVKKIFVGLGFETIGMPDSKESARSEIPKPRHR